MIARAWKHLAQGEASDPLVPRHQTVQALAAWREELVGRHTERTILIDHGNAWRVNRLAPDDPPVPGSARESAREVSRAMERASIRLTDKIHEAVLLYDAQAAAERREADAVLITRTFGPRRPAGKWQADLAQAEARSARDSKTDPLANIY